MWYRGYLGFFLGFPPAFHNYRVELKYTKVESFQEMVRYVADRWAQSPHGRVDKISRLEKWWIRKNVHGHRFLYPSGIVTCKRAEVRRHRRYAAKLGFVIDNRCFAYICCMRGMSLHPDAQCPDVRRGCAVCTDLVGRFPDANCN